MEIWKIVYYVLGPLLLQAILGVPALLDRVDNKTRNEPRRRKQVTTLEIIPVRASSGLCT